MHLQFIGFIVYFAMIGFISLSIYLRSNHQIGNYSQLILGNRSINYVLTAFSAHASDMSDWLFMAFPAALYTSGLAGAWIAIGLICGMICVWNFIAPQLRKETDKYKCLTLSTYFERRFNDTSGTLKILSAIPSLFFFAVYIAAGLKGFGFLAESVFELSYITGISLAIICAIFYIILGGYHTLAWIDSFQALFLLAVIFYVPYKALLHIGGLSAITAAANAKQISLSLLPLTKTDWANTLFMAFSWAIGYCGTPHILTKFMGINNVNEMHKAKYLGLTWQASVLFAAGLTGLIGIAYFPYTIVNPELIFVEIVKNLFNTLTIGFILSAVAGATLSVITAQMLVLVSVLTEDLYHGSLYKKATERELLWVYRLSIVFIAIISYWISLNKLNSIQQLVHYAWMGFGCSFGPLVLLALHSTYINKYGAYASIITGAIIAALWHSTVQQPFMIWSGLNIPAVIPGFILSICAAYTTTLFTKKLILSK